MSWVVFLQNAWSGLYAGIEWPRHSWLAALAESRSGKRLRILRAGVQTEVHNANPLCGATASSNLPPDPQHIERVLSSREWSGVVACGKNAEGALTELWTGPLLIVPHPAHRLLTDELYRVGNQVLRDGHTGRLALRQQRDAVLWEQPPGYSAKEAPRGGTNFWRLKSGGEVGLRRTVPAWSRMERQGGLGRGRRVSAAWSGRHAGAGFIEIS